MKIPAPVRFRSAHLLPAQNALVKKPALVGPFAYLSTAAWSNFPLLYRVHRLLPFTVGTSHSLRVSWYKNCRINFHNFRGTTARGPKPFPLQCRRPPTNEGPGAGRVARSPDLTPAESPETSGKHGSQKRNAQRALLRPLQPQRYFQLPPDHDIAVNARPRHRQNRAQNALDQPDAAQNAPGHLHDAYALQQAAVLSAAGQDALRFRAAAAGFDGDGDDAALQMGLPLSETTAFACMVPLHEHVGMFVRLRGSAG